METQLNTQGDALYARMVGAIGKTELVELVRSLRETADKLS
jgi:hypothetical protein